MSGLVETIRIFPLGEVVLFPDTLLPLHIFEPRYRQLLADAIASDRRIGMVLIRRDTAPPQTPAPDLYQVGCVGRVAEHQPLPDGRSIIVLRGLLKFRIRRELPGSEPYRTIEAQILHEPPVPAEHMRRWRDELHERLTAYVRSVSGDVDAIEKLFERVQLERLINYLSASLPLEVVEKQSLLECATVEQRFYRLCEIMEFKAAEARLGMDSARGMDA
jgi:Lon protease-like protein